MEIDGAFVVLQKVQIFNRWRYNQPHTCEGESERLVRGRLIRNKQPIATT